MLIHLYFESSGSNLIKRNLRTLPPQNHNTTTQERRPRDRSIQATHPNSSLLCKGIPSANTQSKPLHIMPLIAKLNT
ncbi:hypothetical protein AAHA92_07242 [Salvia divinorum]|uniref:Uncharacterized protein n=1 Tax=Salvia divinorum TaxID=28513 RepID=A0ABD1I9A2_SALDI